MNRQDDYRRERSDEWQAERPSDWEEERRRREQRALEEDRFRRERGETWAREGRQVGEGGWGREDDRSRQSGWGGGWRSARESDYPQGGYGTYGGQDFPRERYAQGQRGTSWASQGVPAGYQTPYGGSQGGGYRESFFGRGPRNYVRSDERIREDVCERLTEHPGIDATDIEIAVAGREVTLEGTVDDREQKRMAEDLIEFIPGVKDVHNHLKSRHGGGLLGALFGGDRDRDRERETRDPSRYLDRDRDKSTSGTAMDRPSNIFEGMEVQSRDGQKVGRVKTLRGSDFLLDRPRKRELVVPRTAVGSVTTTIVMLNQDADRIDEMGWQESGVQETGAPGQSGRRR